MISDTFVGQDHGTLYHLIQKDLWEQSKQSGKPYLPPTYEAVSCTAATRMLCIVPTELACNCWGDHQPMLWGAPTLRP
jgi:hypothetical protein